MPDLDDVDAWERVLLNLDILVESQGRAVPTVAGLLLFGHSPNRRLPQAGITATAFKGNEKDYDTEDEELIRGPLVPALSDRRRSPQQIRSMGVSPKRLLGQRVIVDTGVIDRAVDFVMRNMGVDAWLEGARRHRKGAYPLETIREAVVNAVTHRDYTLSTTDVELSLYSDRLEIVSPGRLPNGITVEKMAEGARAARNELIKEVLRDYLVEDDSRFTVRLWK